MARTKKQTIDAATERKRQFQEEIHNRTVLENTKEGEKLDTPSSETTNAKSEKLRIRPSKLSDVVKEGSSRMSSPSKSSNECSVFPQAVVRVTDICKSPAEIMNEDSVRKLRDSSPRNKETRDFSPRNKDSRNSVGARNPGDIKQTGKDRRDISPKTRETNSDFTSGQKDHSDKNIFEVMELTPPKKRSPKKTSPSSKAKDLEESLRVLKSESERVRLEKSKKFNTEGSPKSSPKTQSPGRRSPRNQSPSSSSQSKIPNSPGSTGVLEKQRINIFTDDIGKDLGKRIRSPRRLSEDMIALPIFSLRARTASPKEGAGFSKYAEDGSSIGFADSVNSSSNIFKTPTSKKVSNQKTTECPDTFLQQPKTDTVNVAGGNTSSSMENPSLGKRDTSQDSLMSSICRDVVQEMASARSDLFMTKGEKDNHGNGDCAVANEKQDQVVEEVDTVMFEVIKTDEIGESGDGSVLKSEEVEMVTEDVKHSVDCKTPSGNDNEQDGLKPSLLCAMLVGGSHVVENYSQKRQRYNPEVTEISDSEAESSRAQSPNPVVDQTQGEEIMIGAKEVEDNIDEATDAGHEVDKDKKCRETDVTVGENQVVDDSNESKQESENVSILNEGSSLDAKEKSEEMMEVSGFNSEEEEKKADFVPKCVATDSMKDGGEGEFKGKDSDEKKEKKCDDSKMWKKRKIEFASQLKKVNDDILKLLEIDVEDQFMNVPDTEEIIKETERGHETKLYKLISNLSVSLKNNPNTCDTIEIDKIVDTCPKGAVHVFSSSFSDKKWDSILSRLKHEKSEVRRLRHRLKREHMDADMENLVEKMSASTLHSTHDESNDNLDSVLQCGSDNGLSKTPQSKSECAQQNEQVKDKKESLTSVENTEKNNEQNSCLLSTSSSSLNGSLCDLDLDGITHAATQALKMSNLISDTMSEPGTSCGEVKIYEGDDKSNLRRRFQKSKTCGDFSQETPSPSTPSRSGPLRRTNSSPQLLKSDTSLHSRSSSPNLGKDQVKSKLGGKIPVPGTSYCVKSAKKTVRKPRMIMDPKPLDILLQFINDEKASKDVFYSQGLQRFLWMPSNRMIVTPAIRNEISIADKTAEEAWKKKLQLMQEEDERQRMKDEEVDIEYMKYEPGFDEVDGLLFMSFSSEAELIAHVRVEKALEWDKDDTMLRVARAKTFEETKAINGDMKGVKMKRLRGQHMRWKKYKRLYGNEVGVVLTAKEKNLPLGELKILEKTSDVSKIKGWKKKSISSRPPAPEAKENEMTPISSTPHTEMQNFDSSLTTTPEGVDFQNYQDMEEFDSEKKDVSSSKSRQFNFSDRKAHKQLFKELNMDWEDRMIHRKLGGWSLKGNRPKEFSQAAKKRELKEIKALGLEVPSSTKSHHSRSTEGYADAMLPKKRVVFPLITERMARSCLQTLELSEDLSQAATRRKRKKRFRNTNSSINTRASLPPVLPTVTSLPSTPQSSVATAGSAEKMMEVSTPEASVCLDESTINTPASPSLSLDLPEDTVMEGVEIVSRASTPSVTESGTALNLPQVKSCSTPGCRYGCICHLLQSQVTKPLTQDCKKEHCRLGCICDSLHSEQPAPSHTSHCRKPSCMLECRCSPDASGTGGVTGGAVDDSEELPHLSALKQRPSRAGERFSNLPRREKTHRSAKNLDAITRKAMMLYETSEIYCEKVEKTTRKKSETVSSPPTTLVMGYPSSSASSQSFMSMNNTARTSTAGHSSIEPTLPGVAEQSEPPASLTSSTVAFNAVNLVTSEVSTVPASHFPSSRSQLFPWRSRRVNKDDEVKVDIEMDDVRQTLPVMEPSTHKRKRKSHPLSDEIFSISSCARIQTYPWSKDRDAKLKVNLDLIEYQARNFTTTPASTSACSSPSLPDGNSNQDMSLKISDVCTLAEEEQKGDKKDQPITGARSEMDGSNDVVDLTTSKESPPEKGPEIPAPVSRPLSVRPKNPVSKKHRHHGHATRLELKPKNWHTSMVCLKARAGPKTNANNDEADGDDIKEEDEVKLLEFAANCNWDGAKKEILSRVASCLLRGQYPQPRTLNVRDFVVEILPKARQPSLIPASLRAKLPGQMYSIRVRITKCDDRLPQASGTDWDAPVIDLSQSSPAKQMQLDENLTENISNVKNFNDRLSFASTSASNVPAYSSSSTSLPSASNVDASSLSSSASSASTPVSSLSSSRHGMSLVTDPSFRSSIGISGLNRTYNINLKNSMTPQNTNPQQCKNSSGSRQSSQELQITIPVNDTRGAINITSTPATAAKPLLDLGKTQVISESNLTDVSASNRPINSSEATSVITSNGPPDSAMVTASNKSLDSAVTTSIGLADTSNRLSDSSDRLSNSFVDIPTSSFCVIPNPLSVSSIVVNSTKDSVPPSLPSFTRTPLTTTTNVLTRHPSQSPTSTPMSIAFPSFQARNLSKKISSTAATSLLNPDVSFRKERPSLKVPSFAVATPGNTSISPTSVNELQYVQMMYEVDGQKEKKKTLIAVPISLTGASVDGKDQSTLSTVPILTVPKPGIQSKHITIAPRNKAKLPQVLSGTPVIMKLPQVNTAGKTGGPTALKSLQIIPLSSVSSLLSNTSTTTITTTKESPVTPSASILSSANPTTKIDNEIVCTIGNKICGVDKYSVRKDVLTQQEGTSVTPSRDRPIPSTEVSPPREIIPLPSNVNNSSPLSNGVTEQTLVLSSDSENDQLSEVGNKSLDDHNKSLDQTCENTVESNGISCKAVVSDSQIPKDKIVSEGNGLESCNILQPVADTQTAVTGDVKKTEVCVEDNSIGLCDVTTVAVCCDAPTIASDLTVQSISSNHFSASQSESSPVPDSHRSHDLNGEANENGCVTKPCSESNENTFEVVDIDDLLVPCASDVITTGECIDRSSGNISSLDNTNGLDRPHQTSSKRRLSPELSVDVDCPPSGSKKLRLLPEISGIVDEDSNLSSLITASPQSMMSLQKSAFSSGRSSGSMEDVISSDEEIDVGEDLASYQTRVERAWENDHSSMFSKAPPKCVPVRGVIKPSKKKEPQFQDNKEKVEYHNFLERNRRAKLKELFDTLSNTILSVRGLKKPSSKETRDADGAYIMPKATILTEAKSTILYLNDKDRHGKEQISQLVYKKDMLFSQLKDLKKEKLTDNAHSTESMVNVSCEEGKSYWVANEEEGDSTEMKIKCHDNSLLETTSDAATQMNVLPAIPEAEDVVVDSPCSSIDVNVESCPVYDNTTDNLMCTEGSVEQYEMEFQPM